MVRHPRRDATVMAWLAAPSAPVIFFVAIANSGNLGTVLQSIWRVRAPLILRRPYRLTTCRTRVEIRFLDHMRDRIAWPIGGD